MSEPVVVIDSGGANIGSVLFALERLGKPASLTADATRIQSAKRVILPGVGAAKDAMSRLDEHGLVDVIRGLRQPVLGICLGMHLLLDASEEEDVDCLGLIPGVARKLDAGVDLPVPNMGWCPLTVVREHRFVRSLGDSDYCYFVHSYAHETSEHTVATTRHTQEFSAIVAKNNFIAAQFHPERSAKVGAQLLTNFLQD